MEPEGGSVVIEEYCRRWLAWVGGKLRVLPQGRGAICLGRAHKQLRIKDFSRLWTSETCLMQLRLLENFSRAGSCWLSCALELAMEYANNTSLSEAAPKISSASSLSKGYPIGFVSQV